MEFIYQIMAILGGGGVIVIALSKFIGDIWKDRIKERERRRTEESLEIRKQKVGLRRVQADRFANSQYEIYLQLWESLQSLSLTVDALWQKATTQNVGALAQELRDTKDKIQRWSLFFEDHHRHELLQLIKILEEFRAGKILLIDIRNRRDLRFVSIHFVEEQIEENRTLKERFENLLEELRCSFRDRLSGIDLDVA